MDSNDRFLNPYNFVRYLDEGKNDKTESKLLGKCRPPPHDRFLSLNGRIECKLEAVTPIFISDSEFVESKPVKGGEHKFYRFFKLRKENGKEKFAIPSTSLRGMLRSVFEAATDSCFSVFEGDKRLSHREIKKARIMKPSIVLSLPDNNSCGEVDICNSARVPFNLLKGDWGCGDVAYAIIDKRRNPKVTKISEKSLNNGTKGWLKITGQNIPGKKNEYFFYPTGKKVKFSKEPMEDYNKVLSEQIENEFSTKFQNSELSVGDLIYVEVTNNEVVNIALVKIPRLLYRNSIRNLLLPSHLSPCSKYNNLCPACRVFGWVNQNSPKDLKKKVAYAGRVKISHAEPIRDISDEETLEVTLAILSSPKPTATFFYLLKNGEPDSNVNYDTDGAQLRGRKFYRHQEKPNAQEYQRVGDDPKNHLNRTIIDALKPGAEFKFTIEFENLAPVELGALLWSIEMENKMCHKLGLAKPLGFGSVKLSIDEISVLDVKKRYNSLTDEGWKKVTDQKMKWVNLFKEVMSDKYEKSFKELNNIKDLKAISSPSILPVHYPRMDKKPDEKGENFKWFAQKIPLEIASKDTGLAYNFINKKEKMEKKVLRNF
ncbi:MAG: CRISPR-associated RAMP family protein [Candidatus Altiarchaeales archaeon WOR_SM1_79]|nr:MAG: CRISPR-associated RAMP family protein [Candidatus Altiarchaeales archaeon WOR_SM1_79]